MKYPKFGALYLAEDLETAHKEKHGLYKKNNSKSGLSSDELSLIGKESNLNVCVRGEILEILNSVQINTLEKFFNIIKIIKLPKKLIKKADDLNINPLLHVKTLSQLRKSILLPNWRDLPMLYDIPSNSQIVGQLAHHAGIEAILYPSKMNQNKNCLAIYPNNFCNSTSYIEIEGEVPRSVSNTRIDTETFMRFI